LVKIEYLSSIGAKLETLLRQTRQRSQTQPPNRVPF
jgi:hypothetical protein